MTVTTRTAPAGARMMHAVASRQATATPPLNLRLRDGQTLQFSSQAEMAAAIRRMTASNAPSEPAPGQPDPTPAAPPNTPSDTSARLDAQDAQLQDHEARIAALEERSPPLDVNDGAANVPAEARAATGQPQMVDAGALYGRMRALRIGQKAEAPGLPDPVAVPTAAGTVLDGRAITARHNAAAGVGRTA